MQLRPGLSGAGGRRPDRLFPVSALATPKALSDARQKHDRYQCASCGFTSAKYQMTLQVGPSPRRLDDLRTVCRACWQVAHLEATQASRAARLIWAPELTQAELNRRMPEVYAARVSAGPVADLARRLFSVLHARAGDAEARTGFSDLAGLVDALATVQGEPERFAEFSANTFDAGLRVLPLDRWIAQEADMEFNLYPQMLAYWRSSKGPLHKAHLRLPVLAHDWLARLNAKA